MFREEALRLASFYPRSSIVSRRTKGGHMYVRKSLLVVFAASLFLTLGCGGGDELELIGSYVDGYGTPHEITATTWTMGLGEMASVFHIDEFNNSEEWAVALNDSENAWNPNLWSRFDWTYGPEGDLFYCQTAFDAASKEEALTAAPADRADLETGCGGFAWSKMIPQE
jgi:hypothetical protein